MQLKELRVHIIRETNPTRSRKTDDIVEGGIHDTFKSSKKHFITIICYSIIGSRLEIFSMNCQYKKIIEIVQMMGFIKKIEGNNFLTDKQ